MPAVDATERVEAAAQGAAGFVTDVHAEAGKFNLFPYRRPAARRIRRRVLVELALAAVVGGSVALGGERLERHRAVALATRQLRDTGAMRDPMVRLKPRLAHADLVEAARIRDRRRDDYIDVLRAQRRRVVEVLESVGRLSPRYPGVSLRAMEIDAAQLVLDGAATDIEVFTQWLATLKEQGVRTASAIDVLERDGTALRFLVRSEMASDAMSEMSS